MALPPPSGIPGHVGGPDGYSYGAILVAGEDDAADIAEVLRGIRFTGWIAPPRGGWLVVVGDPGAGVVARKRAGVIEAAETVAAHVPGPVFAIRVRRDRQLGIVAWQVGAEVGRYSSDPSREPNAGDDVLAEPVGIAYATLFAALADRSAASDELTELLSERSDPRRFYESERLRTVLRLLGMPDWLVAVGALPRDVPTGPRAREFTRLRAGTTGAVGVFRHAVVKRVRRDRIPSPIIADPPRESMGMDGIEPWML